MEKTTEALQFELPIDLVAGKVDASGVVNPVKKALDEVGKKLSSEKIKFSDIGFDEAQIRQDLMKLPNLVKEASTKAQKMLGSGLPSGDIASEFAKRLKTTEGVINSQGKVLVRRAREVLKEVAAEAGHPVKGLTNGKGGNQLSDLLAIQGKSLDDALKHIRDKSKGYRSLIKGFSEAPANFKKGQFATLSKELSGITKQLKELRGEEEYLLKTQLKTAEMTGTASIKAGEKAAAIAAGDLKYRKGIRLSEAIKRGKEIIAAHDKAEKEAAAEEVKNLNYRKGIRLSEAKRKGAESTALVERFEGIQSGSDKLRAGRKYATQEEFLSGINAQAKKVREALGDFSPQINKKEYEWLEKELKALRILAENTKAAINETKGMGITNTGVRVERARGKLEDAKSHLADLPNNAPARERLQLLTAQRAATEQLITALRDLKREEDKAYQGQVSKRDAYVKAFGGNPAMPAAPDHSAKNAEIQKLSRSVSGLNEQLAGLDNLWNKVSQSMGLFLRYAVIYRIFYEISNSVTALVQSVIALQGALVNIKSVTNATTGQMVGVASAIKDVAQSTSFSTEDVANGAQTLVQAGIPLKDFATSLKATADLASSTASGFQETADVISTYKQVYKDMDVQTIADKIRNAVNISKLDMQGVQTMANYVLETSEAYKISLDAMQGALTTLKNAGIKDSTAGTGLRQGILELLSPDARTLKALQARYAKLGIQMSQETIKNMFAGFRDANNPILAVVNELQKLGMGGAGENDLARVFDVRAENVIKTLVQNKEALIANEVAMRQTGTAAEGAKTQLEGLKNSFQNLGETVVGIAASASEGFIENIVGMLHKATKLLDDFSAKVTARKAETGDTGMQSALTTGALTTVLSLAGKASVGVSALRGMLATAAVEIVKIFAPADAAVQKLAKAAEAAANALTLLLIAKGLPGVTEKLGRTVIGDKAVDYIKGGDSLMTAKMSQSIKAGEASVGKIGAMTAAAAAGLAAVKSWGAKILTWGSRLTTGPAGLITGALLFAADYFDLWSRVTGGDNEEKLAEIAKAKQAALEDQAANLKSKQKELEDLKRESEQRKENQKLLAGASGDFKSVIDKYTSGADSETANEVTSLLSKAAKGAVALGTKALETVTKQISEKLGGANISQYDLSTDLQKLDTVFQQVESARKTYIESVVKAQEDLARDPSNVKAQAIVSSWNRLSDAQQAALSGVSDTAKEVDTVVAALGKVTDLMDYTGAVKLTDELFSNQKKHIEELLNQFKSTGDSKVSQAIKSKLLEAVTNGEDALVEYIINRTESSLGLSGLFDRNLINVAKDNKIQAFLAPFKEAQKANADLMVKDATRVDPAAFDQEFLNAEKQRSAGNAAGAVSLAELEKQLATRRSLLDQFTSSVKMSSDENVNISNRKSLDALNKEIADVQDKIAAAKRGELVGAQGLESAQRGFLVGEEQIRALQDKLKTAHTEKLHSVDKEVGLLKEIFDLQSQQLEVEKKVLAATFAKLVEQETNLKTDGLSPEELLKAMSGPAGKDALEKSKDLAESYKELARVVNKQKDLQDKYNTDVDNVRRKDLEAKEKSAKSAYDKQAGKTTSLESKLQTTTERLTNAREKLREAYEKQAELEEFFTNQLREISEERKTARDVRATLAKAQETGSTDLAKQAATDAKGLMDSGEISQSEAKSLTKQARQIAYDAQAAVISREQANVQALQASQNTLAAAVNASKESQDRLKDSLDSLTSAIAALNGEAAANGVDLSKTDKYGASLPKVPSEMTGDFWGGQSDNLWQSAKDFNVPTTGSGASAVSYDKSFFDRARSVSVNPAAAQGVYTPAAARLAGTTAGPQVEKQPIIFQVGDSSIRADAQVSAVNQFKTEMQLMSIKQGRKS